MKIHLSIALSLLCCSSAEAQTAHLSGTVPDRKGEAKRVICETEETIGSRLGKRKLCLTVEEWTEKQREHREFTEDVQSGTYARESAVQVQAPMLQGLEPQ